MLGTLKIIGNVIADWLRNEEVSGSRYSRDNIVVAGGVGVLPSGTVLLQQTAGAAVGSLEVDNVGDGTIATGAVGAGAQQGTYRVSFTSATAFGVTAPDGSTVGTGVVGTAFNTGGVNFTITAGETAFKAGDEAAVTIDPGSGKYAPLDAAPGAGAVLGILCLPVDISTGDVAGAAVVRHAQIAPSGLRWGVPGTGDPVTPAVQAAALKVLRAQGVLTVREA